MPLIERSFVKKFIFLNKALASGILFLISVAFIWKPPTLGTNFSISVAFTLNLALVTQFLISGLVFLISVAFT